MVHVMALAVDQPGVLRRITGLYGSRGYRVVSITAGSAGEPGLVRVTLTLDEPPARADRFARQLRRLVDVVAVDVVEASQAVSREIALIKVEVDAGRRPEVLQVAEVFRAQVVDAAPRSVVLEITGNERKIDALISLLSEFGVAEAARTGAVVLRRGGASVPGARIQRTIEQGVAL